MRRGTRALASLALFVVGCAHQTAPVARDSAEATLGARAKRALDLYARGPRHRVEAAQIVAQIASDIARAHPGEPPVKRGAPPGYPWVSPDGRHVLQAKPNRYVTPIFVHERGGPLIAVSTEFRVLNWVGPGLLLVSLERVREDGPRLADLRLWELSSGAVHELPIFPQQLKAAGGRVVVLQGASPTYSIDVLDRSTMAPMKQIAAPPLRGPSCEQCHPEMNLSDDGAAQSAGARVARSIGGASRSYSAGSPSSEPASSAKLGVGSVAGTSLALPGGGSGEHPS